MNTLLLRCFFTFLFFTLTGCGSFHLGVKQEQINTDYYANPQELLKTANLPLGITEPKLLKLLKNGGGQQLIQVNKAEDIQKILFGNITPQTHKEDLADISDWILAHHVFSLPYKNVREEFAFEPIPIAYTFFSEGPEMNILFITQKEAGDPSTPYVLVRTIVAGTENAKTKTKEYIWQGLGTALIGVAKKLIF